MSKRIVWSLNIEGYKTNKKGKESSLSCYDLNDIDLEEIARLIIEGNTSGFLDSEEEVE
jgi:hypothetical protein